MKPALIFLVILASLMAQAKTRNSTWRDGVLKRVTKDHLTGESNQLGKKPPKHGLFLTYYFVEADNNLYEGDDVTLKQNEKGFPVSLNSQVKFLVAGNEMYLRDDRGKSHKLRLVNVIPTEAVNAQPAPATPHN